MILARFRRGLILGSALTLGVGLASWQNSALAGVSEQGYVKDVPSLTSNARASGAIVVAENDGDDNGDDKKHRKGKNANRDKDDDNRHGDGGGDNGHRNGNNGNWNDNGNWKKYGNKGDHNGDGNWGKNGYQHWSQNHKNYGNGWSGYNNNWNKNWDRRAYVRNWNPQPYYASSLAASFWDRFWRPTA